MIPEAGSCRNLREHVGKSGISCRKTREFAGSGSSIPAGNFRKIFRCFSDGFLQEGAGIQMESTGKSSKIFRSEYCFHFPAISGAFLPFPAVPFRSGDIITDNSSLYSDISSRIVSRVYIIMYIYSLLMS